MDNLTNQDPVWITVLRQAIKDLKSQQVVADKLGYARPTVTLALNGKYVGSTQKIEAKVMAVFGRVVCPYLTSEITADICRGHATGEPPLHNPSAMRHYRACQSCPMNLAKAKGV